MKKVRIIFTAIAVLTVVGGALAFKAKDFTSTTLFSRASDGHCTLEKAYLTKASGTTTISASIDYDGACTTFTTTTQE
jgi:hypothetical protein